MTVATLRLNLRIVPCPTARDRRRQTQAIADRLHQAFNVSVVAVDGDESADRAVLVVATVGRSRREARETLLRVADAVAAHPRAELLDHEFSEV